MGIITPPERWCTLPTTPNMTSSGFLPCPERPGAATVDDDPAPDALVELLDGGVRDREGEPSEERPSERTEPELSSGCVPHTPQTNPEVNRILPLLLITESMHQM